MNKVDRIKELVAQLNEASKAYYMEDREIMSNLTYDALYDELLKLEEETGTVLSNSPTIKVGYEVVSELPKEAHPQPMLSLDKTKDPEVLRDWLNGKDGVMSWKMDGLTVVLTYEDGELTKAVTRGNGEIGEVITANAKTFVNIPAKISYKGKLSLRGEAIISYSDFERINAGIADVDAKYKNPRNLCSGSVRQLSNKITAERNVRFYAFSLVEPDDRELVASFENSFIKRFEFLKGLGFEVVEYKKVNADNIIDTIKWFSEKISENDFPSDGLVLSFEDVEYGRSLGRTAKFPRNAIAFKWKDEQVKTILRDIEWSPSRTGLINPVAIFDPVELEGTTVSRASVHNVSIVKEFALGIGDEITVYKANMIIPQIAENLTRSGNVVIPETCPSCGGKTVIRNENGTETLFCENEMCPAKNIKGFALFVSRNAMNIDGMSEATIEKFTDRGFLKEFSDFYKLDRFHNEIVTMEGFGEKSYINTMDAIERSKKVTVGAFIYSLGIPGVGVANAKLIAKYFDEDPLKIKAADVQELSEIEGIGEVIAGDIAAYFKVEKNIKQYDELVSILEFEKTEMAAEQDLAGKTFVITGSLNSYSNRDELKAEIESRGGKVAGSVSKNTTYLINNDITSTSGKNKKAKELGVPIISEEDYKNL
ncbi:NAD-dependent DNA ligase LigA [Eubacterium sp.]|uniref:NAD-dependent DNA ligase LigA n=1 Tax=Eubacterium sp. TaxID=142586 RepID=UPI0025845A1F|nr:NAD-dependent DNA ligase LigA [Eubacterium sp.]MCR5369056.1 NAD-dependent DNA ligase LigA [Eubacterium sp.]